MTHMIRRFLIKEILNSKKSILLLGPRQVGKTTLIKDLKPDLFIQLADESVFLAHIKDPSLIKRQVLAVQKKKGLTLVAVDEVQRHAAMLNTIQTLIDDNKNLRFLLTGSSARKLKRGQANLLPGRVISHELFPVNFWERELQPSTSDLESRLVLGSLPEILENQKEASEILRSYTEIYLREEIQAEALTRDLGSYSRFLDVAAECSGQYVNYSKLASDIEINKETIRRFFQILEDTLLIFRLPAFVETKKNRKVRQTDRFLFFDLGVRNAILNKLTSHFTPTELGPLFEQWCILQILSYVKYNKKNWKLTSFRDELGNEVDLIIETPTALVLVEIKYQQKFRPEFSKGIEEFEKINLKKKEVVPIIVYTGTSIQRSKESIDILPYSIFLKKFIPNLN